ncbi:MAG: nicotinate-nucleotide--dimethylbenzimidazole phosphoribosyltransferase [Candidatus Nanopelagicales bacterium]
MTDTVERNTTRRPSPGSTRFPGPVPAPDAAAFTATIARRATLTKPAGALGRLEPLSAWIAAVQGTCPPRPFTRPLLVILAGDHGVARAAGTSAYPPEVTAQMVVSFVTGGAGANVLARRVGATVRVVDVSVDADDREAFDPQVASRRVRRSCRSVDQEPAMTVAEAVASIRLGADPRRRGPADRPTCWCLATWASATRRQPRPSPAS